MKRLLIFDAYGTLFSTGNGSIEATRKILALQDKEIDAASFYRKWKEYHRLHIDEANRTAFLPERDIFARDLSALYADYQIHRPAEADVQIMLKSLENRILYPEVIASIGQLRTDYRIVIGSTTDTSPLMQNIRYNNLVTDGVYTSEVIGKYKPDPYFYQYILQHENCTADDAVFIGDSLTDDIAGPQAVGLQTIWVNRGKKPDPSANIRPDFVVGNIGQVRKALF